ncbi:MAG: hypothetical protein IJE68_01890 [Clostridia bacterium]|nr:hypothetical protein [Clostridia bacterium]
MNKLSKLFLGIIIILVIALGILISSYFNMKKIAQENLDMYLKSESKITLLIRDYPELQNVDFKALEAEVNK